jgi:aspartate 1-decarboxylase
MTVYKTLVHAKIHRARVTSADLNYVGSITIDAELLEAAGIADFERVQVCDVTNGARLETYAIPGERGSGTIQVNGAGAHLVHVDDIVIIMAYAQLPDPLPTDWHPRVLLMDEATNRVNDLVTEAFHPLAMPTRSAERVH